MRKMLSEVGELKGSLGDFLLEKLRQLLHILENFFGSLVEKADRFFPPETRSETLSRWAHVGLTVVLPVALTLLCLYSCCCRGCCSAFFRAVGRCFSAFFRGVRRRCCCCCGGGARRMMRAPGRSGAMMPRAPFEADPRGYFLNLRAKNDLLY